jgi:LmbE family N-acetylglucosaminyl deacetylase
MADELIPPFPDGDLRQVLCVAAHPDDLEYGTSSAIAAWTARGVGVVYLLLTRGEAGIDGSSPDQAAQLRTQEQIAASKAVGVSRVEFLDYPDAVLEYSLALRRDIARVIRSCRPDAVVTGSWEAVSTIGLNQADHRVASLAVVDALRDAGNRWVFPSCSTRDGGLIRRAGCW